MSHGELRYIAYVMLRSSHTMKVAHRMVASTCVVLFLCICVLAQMLGMPITLFSLIESTTVFTESVSEDFSFPVTEPKPRTSSVWSFYTERQSSPYLPVFVTSVFHPPQA